MALADDGDGGALVEAERAEAARLRIAAGDRDDGRLAALPGVEQGAVELGSFEATGRVIRAGETAS